PLRINDGLDFVASNPRVGTVHNDLRVVGAQQSESVEKVAYVRIVYVGIRNDRDRLPSTINVGIPEREYIVDGNEIPGGDGIVVGPVAGNCEERVCLPRRLRMGIC